MMIFQIRSMASRAVVPFISNDFVRQYLEELIDKLPTKGYQIQIGTVHFSQLFKLTSSTDHNFLNGILQIISSITRNFDSEKSTDGDLILHLVEKLKPKLWLLSGDYNCGPNKTLLWTLLCDSFDIKRGIVTEMPWR